MALGNIVYTPVPALRQSDVVDNLLSTATNLPGSANQLRVLDEKLANLRNESILINGDFRFNQSGITSPFNKINTYCLDGWYKQGGVLHLQNDGIKIVCDYTYDDNVLLQKIESPERYAGQYLTVSVCVGDTLNDGSNFFRIGIISNSKPIKNISLSSNNICTATFMVPEDSIMLHVNFTKFGTASNSIEIKWVKLELGSIATPHVPEDTAIGLTRCQRYFYTNKVYGDQFYNGAVVGSVQSKTFINVNALFPATMRITPAIRVKKIALTSGADSAIDLEKIIAGNISKNGFSWIKSLEDAFSEQIGTNYYVIYEADARL